MDIIKYSVLVIHILDIIIKLIMMMMMMIYSVSNYHSCVLTCKHTYSNV